jgi:PhoH-like ATPase
MSAPKIFVLDTSVLLFDHNSILSFENNDVAIPITVLEELDKFKVGSDTKNYEAREVIRFIDKISTGNQLNKWIKLPGNNKGKFKILLSEYHQNGTSQNIFGTPKNDHKILDATIKLAQEAKSRKVILVSKDINLRVKAKALGITAQDFETGKVKDVNSIKKGMHTIDNVDSNIIRELYTKGETSDIEILGDALVNNGYYILKNGKTSALAYYNPFKKVIEKVEKQIAFGIKPKNAEQAFALHAILNPDIKLVTLQGVAGTGKTLLALAGALEQHKQFNQIMLARPIVPLSNKDLGYLPGDALEKINPYMQPLFDNLKFIKSQFRETERKHKLLQEMEDEGKIIITPLAYIRGRSFANMFFIIDESQNLTPHEVKTIITRAGEGTKLVFTGDVKQIDTPYLDEESNGLTYLIDRLRGQELFTNVILEKGERSELANLANELL